MNRPEPKFPADLLKHLDELPNPRDFSKPQSSYKHANEAHDTSRHYYQEVMAESLADRLLLILPKLEPWLGHSQMQTVANAFTTRKDIPVDSTIGLRSLSSLILRFLTKEDGQNWRNTWNAAPYIWLCQMNPLTKPHNPIPHRCKGPAKDTI